MIRPLISLKRLYLEEKEGRRCQRNGKETNQLEGMNYLEFILYRK